MKIMHIITGLNVGGAEVTLKRLLLSDKNNQICIISLTNKGVIGSELDLLGFNVIALGLNKINFLLIFFRLYKSIKIYKPDVVQTWLYHADLLGGLAAKFANINNIVWGIRTTRLTKGSRLTSVIRKLCAWLSYAIPKKIVIVAEASKKRHIEIGYDASKMLVIPNGFKTKSVDSLKINSLKSELNIQNNDLVIGCVGRFLNIKGQDIFIKAAGKILNSYPNIKFLMVGRGLTIDNKKLDFLINKYAKNNNFILIGEVKNIPVYLKLMDVFCLPSRSEGFPNSLAEAMLAGVPCVATNAGDASILGGGDVPISKIDNPDDLANKLFFMLDKSNEERQLIGLKLKKRVIEKYSIEKMAGSYNSVYTTL